MFTGNNVKLYIIAGIKIITANIIGSKTVQQKDINWSNLIRGNEALVQIKTNIIIELFIPKVNP